MPAWPELTAASQTPRLHTQGGAVSLFVPETFSRAVAVARASACTTPEGTAFDPRTGAVSLHRVASGPSPPPQRVQGGGGTEDHAAAAVRARVLAFCPVL